MGGRGARDAAETGYVAETKEAVRTRNANDVCEIIETAGADDVADARDMVDKGDTDTEHAGALGAAGTPYKQQQKTLQQNEMQQE